MAIFAKLSNYLKESLAELKKVVWPTRTQLINNTIIVIAMALGVAIFFSVLDNIFNYFLELIIS